MMARALSRLARATLLAMLALAVSLACRAQGDTATAQAPEPLLLQPAPDTALLQPIMPQGQAAGSAFAQSGDLITADPQAAAPLALDPMAAADVEGALRQQARDAAAAQTIEAIRQSGNPQPTNSTKAP